MEIVINTEVEKIGRDLMKQFGVKFPMASPDDFIFKQSKECALIMVREFLREHSCYTLNQERWDFWHDVESFLNGL